MQYVISILLMNLAALPAPILHITRSSQVANLSFIGLHVAYLFMPVQDLSNATWAFASLRHYPGTELMNGTARQAEMLMQRFKPQEVANLLWSYATLSADPGRTLLDAIASQMTERIQHFRPQVCYSCSYLHQYQDWLYFLATYASLVNSAALCWASRPTLACPQHMCPFIVLIA